MNVRLEILGLFVLEPISEVIMYSTCTVLANEPKTQVFRLWIKCIMIGPRVKHIEWSGHGTSMPNSTKLFVNFNYC